MKTYEIHPSANIVPMASPAEQKALTEDIRINGQREPAMTYRGKIVDGRCRYRSTQDLKIELEVEALPNNMSIKEVQAYVKSVNTRRNLTRTQKVIVAFRDTLSKGITAKEASDIWAVTPAEISKVKYIAEHRPEMIEVLFNGRGIVIPGSDRATVSVAVVYKYVMEQVAKESYGAELSGADSDHGSDINDFYRKKAIADVISEFSSADDMALEISDLRRELTEAKEKLLKLAIENNKNRPKAKPDFGDVSGIDGEQYGN